MLIVCEGSETEPGYFRALRLHKRLRTTEIEIYGEECGSHPRSVVDYAVRRKKDAEREGLPYAQVWCVFDRDEHERFHEAIDRARSHGIDVALSNPCFELWYLFHYESATAHVERDVLVSRLKRHIPGYDKARPVYDTVLEHQGVAMARAADARRHHSGAGRRETDNPSTAVDLLVRLLNDLADR